MERGRGVWWGWQCRVWKRVLHSPWRQSLLVERLAPVPLEDGVGSLQNPSSSHDVATFQSLQELWKQRHPLCREVRLANDGESLAQLGPDRDRGAQHEVCNQPLYLVLLHHCIVC
jgi:hypothetical protein